ncbi:uracil phosphoribosyltransferase [Zunongwangia sp. F260]|uniref:Uracil phosphoribosyltransferase n=1 Tax=Autumnicola lenta TaxID=3075593 RepID=A0ABU3CLU1_9FLAO|nr:uracil phosphoribosyltransferase [Zunongwangia sp. F260]MDT0647217.1 uracil phosphoribosyltransferase [Zunongwangia sp. F260]
MKDLFEGIEDLFVNVLFAPFDYIREMELESWFLANALNFLFVIVGFLAFLYWMKQLKTYNDNNEENRDPKAHSFLG